VICVVLVLFLGGFVVSDEMDLCLRYASLCCGSPVNVTDGACAIYSGGQKVTGSQTGFLVSDFHLKYNSTHEIFGTEFSTSTYMFIIKILIKICILTNHNPLSFRNITHVLTSDPLLK